MIKVVTTSLLFFVLSGTSPRLLAQNNAATEAAISRAAGEEAARREARIIQLRKTLAEGQALRSKGDLVAAAKRYQEAYDLIQNVGARVDQEQRETIAGLAAVRLELANRAQNNNNLNEADQQIAALLRVDPTNEEAQKFKRENDRKIQERAGREPSRAVTDRIPEFTQEKVNTSTLVQDARFLIEAGKLDEAEAKLRQAAKEDPESRATYHYQTIIQERKYAQAVRRREVVSKDRLVEVEREWARPIPRELLPSPNVFATTNQLNTSPRRQAIAKKLDRIVLEEWYIPGEVPLSEVVKELENEAKKRDPDRRGLNFIVSSQVDRPGPNLALAGAPGAVDPLTGAPIVSAPTESPTIIEEFTVKIDPPLKNLRLTDVLDAIVKVAKPPQGQNQNVALKYSIEDYAVVFSQKAPEQEQLYTRRFKVDPNTFMQGLEGVFFTSNPFQGLVSSSGAGGVGGVGGGGGGAGGVGGQSGTTSGTGGGPGGFFSFGGGVNSQQGGGGGGAGGGSTSGTGGIIGVTTTNLMSNIQDTVRNFFIAAGVDFATNNVQLAGQLQPGGTIPATKSIFFNDRTGVLLVRATLRDLDLIEAAIEALNVTPPLVTIEAKFWEVTQRDAKGLGFDWILGNFLMGGGKIGAQGGTAPSYNDGASRANPYGVFPGSGGIPSALPNPATDGLVTGGLSNNDGLPTLGTITGILTDPQFRVVIRALEERQGADLLSAPKVTTVSGRQARISIEDTSTIITGLSVQGLGGGGVVGGGVGGAGGQVLGQ